MKQNIIVAGTSGFAAEVTQYINDNIRNGTYSCRIKGYIDVTSENMAKYRYDHPFLGSEREYSPQKDDYFVIAIGSGPIRNQVIQVLMEKNASFLNLIHHTALVSTTALMGQGNIICPNTIMGPNARLGDFNIINYFSSVAHDVEIGNRNILAPYSNITGWAKLGSNNLFGSSVQILPGVRIGSNVKIQAGTVVSKNIKDETFYFPDVKNRQLDMSPG